MAPKLAAVDTWRSHATVRTGLAVPGRPIRSLVAEDRSAGGVRDRTGPDQPRGHIRATNDRIAADNTGQHRLTICRGHRAHSPTPAGRRDPPEISDTEGAARAAAPLWRLANDAGGHRGRASPSG